MFDVFGLIRMRYNTQWSTCHYTADRSSASTSPQYSFTHAQARRLIIQCLTVVLRRPDDYMPTSLAKPAQLSLHINQKTCNTLILNLVKSLMLDAGVLLISGIKT